MAEPEYGPVPSGEAPDEGGADAEVAGGLGGIAEALGGADGLDLVLAGEGATG